MEVVIASSPDGIVRLAADAVQRLIESTDRPAIGLATGSSPLPTYRELIDRHRAGRLTFAPVRAFLLDEYVGLPPGHPGTYRTFIEREFTDHVDLPGDALFGPDGSNPDLALESIAYEQRISPVGGVDMQLLGIGRDGHLGFNEPSSSLGSRTLLKTLTDATPSTTLASSTNDIDAVPRHVVTQGVGTILDAGHVVLLAAGEASVSSTPMTSTDADASWDRATLPEGDEKRQAVREMFDAIAPRYDMVNRIMTFRLDVRWRRQTVRDLALPAGSVVLDLASGTGDLCIDLREAGLVPFSMDLSYRMLAADRSGAARSQADILNLPVRDASVDGVTCGFALRNLLELPAFFTELARVVRPGGRIALLDVGVPENRLIRFGNGIYFGKVVPKIGALLSDGAAYRYLPKSVAYLPEPDEMVSMLRDAGFSDAAHHLLSGGLTQQLLATRD